MTYYELIKQEGKKQLVLAGHFNSDELAQYEREGYKLPVKNEEIPHDELHKKKRKPKRKIMRYEDVDWGMFERARA